MSTVVLALLVASVLPIVCSWVSGYGRHSELGEVDNKNPRLQNAKLTGLGARAVAAQGNAWEALMVLVATVLAMQLAGLEFAAYTSLFQAFIVLRVLHALTYFINQDIVRSIVWIGAYGICIYLMIQALGGF